MTGQGRVAFACLDQPPEGACVHEFTCWIRVLPGTPDAVHGERACALWSLSSPRMRLRPGTRRYPYYTDWSPMTGPSDRQDGTPSTRYRTKAWPSARSSRPSWPPP